MAYAVDRRRHSEHTPDDSSTPGSRHGSTISMWRDPARGPILRNTSSVAHITCAPRHTAQDENRCNRQIRVLTRPSRPSLPHMAGPHNPPPPQEAHKLFSDTRLRIGLHRMCMPVLVWVVASSALYSMMLTYIFVGGQPLQAMKPNSLGHMGAAEHARAMQRLYKCPAMTMARQTVASNPRQRPNAEGTATHVLQHGANNGHPKA